MFIRECPFLVDLSIVRMAKGVAAQTINKINIYHHLFMMELKTL